MAKKLGLYSARWTTRGIDGVNPGPADLRWGGHQPEVFDQPHAVQFGLRDLFLEHRRDMLRQCRPPAGPELFICLAEQLKDPFVVWLLCRGALGIKFKQTIDSSALEAAPV